MSVMLSYGGEIQLAIVEITMPGVNGLDFANQLRVERPKTPVLYIPAVGNSVAAESIMQREPESVLAKPFTSERLLKRVRQLLARLSHLEACGERKPFVFSRGVPEVCTTF